MHEIKHDGFRIIAEREADTARLITRNGHDFSRRFPLIIAAVEALPARSCVVDGNDLEKARRIFTAAKKSRPWRPYTIRQRIRMLANWPGR
jgi:ATP-dependent DNA ligase